MWNEDDRDLPLPEDMDDDSADLPEMFCPNCRSAVTEDTQQCPRCGDWITPVATAGASWKRWVIVAAVVLMLVAMARFALPWF